MAYTHIAEIRTFIARAQGKIADLGTNMVQKNTYEGLELAKELYQALTLIADPDCALPEWQIRQIAHLLTHKARLADVPAFYVPGFSYEVLQQEGPPLQGHRHDVSEIDGLPDYMLQLLQRQLKDLLQNQLDAVEYAWVQANARPKVAPVLSLQAGYPRPATNGLFQKGVGIAPIAIAPQIALNSGKKVLALRFYIDGQLQETRVNQATLLQPFIDPLSRYVPVSYRVEADFEVGGTRAAEHRLPMVAPLYHGLLADNAPGSQVLSLTPELSSKPQQKPVLFPFGGGLKPTLAYPAEWGPVGQIMVSGNFPTLTNWRSWQEELVLHPGSDTRQAYQLYQYLGNHNQAFTYTFIW